MWTPENLINVQRSERIACSSVAQNKQDKIALTKVRELRGRSELLTWLHVQLPPAARPRALHADLPITH